MIDNVIPYIGGEEEKSEKEPLKLWGKIEGDHIENATKPNFTAQCIRVPVSNGHLGAVFVNFEKKPEMDDMIEIWNSFKGRAQELEHQSNSSTTLQSLTDRKSIQSVCLKTEWLFLSADLERTHNISISLFVFLTTLFAVPQAVQYYLQSFLPLKVILTNN